MGRSSSSSRSGGSTFTDLLGSESLGFRALRTRAFTVGFLNSDGDLALVEELRTIGVFVNVSFLAGHEISRIFQVVEKELIQGTAIFVEDLNLVSISVINGAGVDDGAEGVDGFRFAGELVVLQQ